MKIVTGAPDTPVLRDERDNDWRILPADTFLTGRAARFFSLFQPSPFPAPLLSEPAGWRGG